MTIQDPEQCCADEDATQPGMCGCPPDCRCSCLNCPCDIDADEPVKCRHCGADLVKAGETWTDRAGFTACVKGQVKPPGERPPLFDVLYDGASVFTPPVLHEPMPAGLEGSERGNGS